MKKVPSIFKKNYVKQTATRPRGCVFKPCDYKEKLYMTPDERSELLRDAERLAYSTIRSTSLYKELPSAQWDELAERLGRVTLRYLEALIDEEFTELERAKELSDVV